MGNYTVSLCMIVKNEEKCLEKCLRSVQGKVDEIIVVDTGSTDSTVQIAEKYNAIIKYFDWIDDFAAARNYSIEGVKSDYILMLDADEYLEENVDLKKELADGKDYYRVKVVNHLSGGHSITHKNVRLFKANVGLKYVGKLHENVNYFENGSKYTNADSNVRIHHTGYLQEVIKDKKKNDRNLRIMESEVERNPGGFSYYNMGCSYVNAGMYEKAYEMFQKSYGLSKAQPYFKYLLIHTAYCLSMMDKAEEAIKLLLADIGMFNESVDYIFNLGLHYSECSYLKDAELMFKRCLTMDMKDESISSEGAGGFMAHYQLAAIYEQKGQIADAFDEAFKAIMDNKNYTPALSLYLKIMKRAGVTTDEMKEHIKKVYPVNSIEELKSLIFSLYKVRHPLINMFDFVFQDEKLSDIRAVAYLLDGKYEEALREWKEFGGITKENYLDVLVLSMILGDKTIINKVKEVLNLSDREWKFIVKILTMDDASKRYFTPEVEGLLLDLSSYLLDLERFEQFEYISRHLLECSLETQNKLARILINKGHSDTAMELLSLNLDRCSKDHEVPFLIGDILSMNSNFTAALDFYNRSLNVKNNYIAYERIYEIYEKLGDKANMSTTAKQIKSKFPLVKWVNNIV